MSISLADGIYADPLDVLGWEVPDVTGGAMGGSPAGDPPPPA